MARKSRNNDDIDAAGDFDVTSSSEAAPSPEPAPKPSVIAKMATAAARVVAPVIPAKKASDRDAIPETLHELFPLLTRLDNIANPSKEERKQLAEVRGRVFALQQGLPSVTLTADDYAALKKARDQGPSDLAERITALKAAAGL